MEQLDFKPAKSTKNFRDNYKLHDMAENAGKDLLIQWGISFKKFGDDRRFEKLWEKGEDKPDLIITYKTKSALLDWKGKHSNKWIANERAVKSYEKWQQSFKTPMLICFLVFDNFGMVSERRFAVINLHAYSVNKKKQWDKNKTVEFKDELPVFNKENLLKFVFN